jgi:hypothetical protein
MKSKLILMVGLLMCLNMTLICGKSRNPGQEIAEMIELEKYLRTANIIEVEIDKYEGRTAPWGVILDDGEISRQGIFKYVNRPRPTLLPDSYQYEIAAYEVSKLLEYPVVPPVVEREVKETLGSLQLLLKGCFPLSQQKRKGLQPSEPQKFSDALSELAVFESLVLCEREPKDIYIRENDWKVCRVDFSQAFSPFAELPAETEITRCSKKFFHNLQKLETIDVKVVLQSHLNDEEIEALLKRKDLIIDKINVLIQEKGEDAILF